MTYTVPPLKLPGSRALTIPITRPFNIDKDCIFCVLPEVNTKWRDHSGNDNHGAITGATLKHNGRFGPCLYLDGLNDDIDFGNLSAVGQSFTVAAWVKRGGSTGAHGTIFSIDLPSWNTHGGMLFYDDNAGTFKFRLRNDADASATEIEFSNAIADNVWYHLVGTCSRAVQKVYLNGEYVTGDTWNHDVGWNTYHAQSGIWAANFFKGWLDEIQVFTRVLTAWEIKALYNQGAP